MKKIFLLLVLISACASEPLDYSKEKAVPYIIGSHEVSTESIELKGKQYIISGYCQDIKDDRYAKTLLDNLRTRLNQSGFKEGGLEDAYPTNVSLD